MNILLEDMVYADQIFDTAKKILKDRELDIFEGNLIHNISYQSLANEYGISPSRVGQILAKSIRKVLTSF